MEVVLEVCSLLVVMLLRYDLKYYHPHHSPQSIDDDVFVTDVENGNTIQKLMCMKVNILLLLLINGMVRVLRWVHYL